MTPRLRVGDRAICVTEDVCNGLIVTVTKVFAVSGYEAVSGFESAMYFGEDELTLLPPRTPSPVAAWFRANLPWLLATLAVGGIAALVIAVLGSEGAL